jgi:hypothetical protein
MGSFTLRIGILRTDAAVEVAARHLWDRCFERRVSLSLARLLTKPRGPVDEKVVAPTAFDSIFPAAVSGCYPLLRRRDDLWRLLVSITANKADDRVKHEQELRRDGEKVVSERALDGSADAQSHALAQPAGREPSPEFAALVAEQCRRLPQAHCDDTLSRVVLSRMERHVNGEIARRFRYGLHTIARRLDLINKAQTVGGRHE